MTNVVIAPNKFKGSLTAVDAAATLAPGIRRRHGDVTGIERPVADGGEGTLDALLVAGFAVLPATAAGPWWPSQGWCGWTRATARAGFSATYALTDLEPDPAKSINHAAELLAVVGDRITEKHIVKIAPAQRN